MSDDNILAHYGVKGMRWGRRKNRSSSSDIKKARKDRRELVEKKYNLSKYTKRQDAANAIIEGWDGKTTDIQKKAAEKRYLRADKKIEAILSSPDVVALDKIGNQLTMGEKLVVGSIIAGGAAVTVGSLIVRFKG